MGICSADAAKEIKNNKAQMSKPVFDVIPEDPQIEHVPAKMEQPTMHEHGRKDGQCRVNRLMRFEGKETVWNCAKGIGCRVHPAPGSHLGKKYPDIEDNDPDGEVRERSGGIVIFIWYHAVFGSFLLILSVRNKK
jgi:hypothetical protein